MKKTGPNLYLPDGQINLALAQYVFGWTPPTDPEASEEYEAIFAQVTVEASGLFADRTHSELRGYMHKGSGEIISEGQYHSMIMWVHEGKSSHEVPRPGRMLPQHYDGKSCPLIWVKHYPYIKLHGMENDENDQGWGCEIITGAPKPFVAWDNRKFPGRVVAIAALMAEGAPEESYLLPEPEYADV